MAADSTLTQYLQQKDLTLAQYPEPIQTDLTKRADAINEPGGFSQLPADFIDETAQLKHTSKAAIRDELLAFEANHYLSGRINYHNRINDGHLQTQIATDAQALKQALADQGQSQLLDDLYPWLYGEATIGHYHNLREKMQALYTAAKLPQPQLYDDIYEINKNEYINLWVLLMIHWLQSAA